jgi:ribose transport system substrate-binding protein
MNSVPGWLGGALLLLGSVFLGCGGEAATKDSAGGGSGTKRLVFLTNGDDPYWDTCHAGLKEAAKELDIEKDGFTVVMDKGNFKPEGQIDKLRQYMTEPDVVGIAISVVQADNRTIADLLRDLQKAGKKVITVDGDVNLERFRDARTFYIGTDNFVAGQQLGKASRQVLQAKGVDKGGYVQFVGYTDNDNARKRMDGVKDAVGSEYEEITRRADQGDRDKARDNVRTTLDNEGDRISALFGIWAYNAPAIAGVVQERGVRDKVVVGTFDAASDAIKAMGDGGIDVMVVQNPFEMGKQLVRLLKAMVESDETVVNEMFPNKDDKDGDIYTTGVRVVVPSEESPVKADQFDEKVVEFMTLPDFEAWLKKYNLKSS